MTRFAVEPGAAHPLGVTACPDGVNFSVFSESATEVVLLLFDSASATEPTQTIRFDPFRNKTFHFWHVFVRGCGPGIFYAYRLDGPADGSRIYVGVETTDHASFAQRAHPSQTR